MKNDLFSKSDLFGLTTSGDESKDIESYIPLPERLRPSSANNLVGQNHLLGDGKILEKMIKGYNHLSSFILWGPPGSGKTTIARLFRSLDKVEYKEISALTTKIDELRSIFNFAKELKRSGKQQLLFVDEIHRFNKSQQDAFLPVIEDGTIILIGATTENPSFSLNNALLSRMQVFTLKALEHDDLRNILDNALNILDKQDLLNDEIKVYLCKQANGDARKLLIYLEMVIDYIKSLQEKTSGNYKIEIKEISELIAKSFALYDRDGDQHYNLISALHKSLRGSDPDAALYYFYRMLNAGEDPLYLIRRMVRMATEDIGLADPTALNYALNVKDAYELLGSPEGDLAIASLVVRLSIAPKSNAIYVASKKAKKFAEENSSYNPPMKILNAPTKFMKGEGYGDGYKYDHDEDNAFSGQNYWPDGLEAQNFYKPSEYGQEKNIKDKLEFLKSLKRKRSDEA